MRRAKQDDLELREPAPAKAPTLEGVDSDIASKTAACCRSAAVTLRGNALDTTLGSLVRLGSPAPVNVGLHESVIVSLRRATRARHNVLESILQLAHPLSRRRYLDALTGFQLFLSTWEPRISSALPATLREWFAARSRYDLLLQDLAQFDRRPIVAQHIRDVCARAEGRIDLLNVPAVFGSMYVLEGSALGGRVISKIAHDAMGLGTENGAAYFNGVHLDTATHWNGFCALLAERVGSGGSARQDACAAAEQTFDALISTFKAIVGDHDAT